MLAPPGHTGVTTLACGFLSCDIRPFNPLIAALPRQLHLPAADGGGSFAQLIQRAVSESHDRRPGAEAMLARMSEILFVDAVRRYLDSLPPEAMGWLGGLRDPYVGRALGLLHEKPAREWTLEELGRHVGLSRSPLHERFVRFVGQPPMQYLTHWRMQLASGLLRSSSSRSGQLRWRSVTPRRRPSCARSSGWWVSRRRRGAGRSDSRRHWQGPQSDARRDAVGSVRTRRPGSRRRSPSSPARRDWSRTGSARVRSTCGVAPGWAPTSASDGPPWASCGTRAASRRSRGSWSGNALN